MTLQLFQPTTDYEEVEAICEVLASHWLGKGQKVQEFEAAWAHHVGGEPAHMVSTNSCTQALFEAMKLTGLGPGDKVIIPSVHFVGAAQAVLAVGASPVYCDVDPYTLNARTQDVLAVMTRYTKAIIFNHYGGVLCDVDRSQLPEHIQIIDDLACAPMAKFATERDYSLGRCDFAVWSFDAMKIITTGDGGMLWCKAPAHAERARQDFCLGVDSGSGLSSEKPQWWEFTVKRYRVGRHLMNDTQAAMGLAQLRKLPALVTRRREIVELYNGQLGNHEVFQEKQGDSYYFYRIQTQQRDALAAWLRARDVYTSFRYWPLHLAYETGVTLPNAERAAQQALCLPLHANLTNIEVEIICDFIQEFYDRN